MTSTLELRPLDTMTRSSHQLKALDAMNNSRLGIEINDSRS